jgi:ribosomal-protein-alanine N-acetyltransferase
MAAVHEAAFPNDPWDEEAFGEMLAQPGVVGFIDERGGVVLLRVVADEAEILTIGVTARRRGIGRALLAAGMAAAREAGAKAMFLEVAAENVAALGLYEAAGFAAVGRRPAYYHDGGDAVVLRVWL